MTGLASSQTGCSRKDSLGNALPRQGLGRGRHQHARQLVDDHLTLRKEGTLLRDFTTGYFRFTNETEVRNRIRVRVNCRVRTVPASEHHRVAACAAHQGKSEVVVTVEL